MGDVGRDETVVTSESLFTMIQFSDVVPVVLNVG